MRAIGTFGRDLTAAMCGVLSCAFWLVPVAVASDNGVPPRRDASDYPVQQTVKTPAGLAAVGAAIVPEDQVRKMFSSEVSRDYIVVEVAMYPADGRSFEADRYDFGLKVSNGSKGDSRVAHADSPSDVALPPYERRPDLGGPESKVNVTQEAGVAVAHTNDPYYGKRTSVGTYEGTTVSNGPPLPSQQSGSGVDRHAIEAKLRDKALPDGPTTRAVAGYLYFPASKKRKNDALELQYTKSDIELDLRLPAK
jgi:hypothetical protein